MAPGEWYPNDWNNKVLSYAEADALRTWELRLKGTRKPTRNRRREAVMATRKKHDGK